MNLAILQILFFVCIPIGIGLLIVGIKMIYKVFNTNILAEIRMSAESVNFEITKSGSYAIWVKAPVFQRNYLDKVKIKIYNQDKQEYKELWYNIFSTQSNNGSVGKMKFLTFNAEAGNYKAELSEGTNLWTTERILARALPVKEADINNCFFQVRENTSWYYGLSGILLIVLGAGGSMAGFVLGLLTEKIWG